MNKIKSKIALCFVFLNLISKFSNARLLDIVISLDSSEKVDGPITTGAFLTLCQKNAYVLVSTHVFCNILKSKKIDIKELDEQYEIYQKAKGALFFFLFIPKEYKAKLQSDYNYEDFKKKVTDLKSDDTPEEIFFGLKINSNLIKLDIKDITADKIAFLNKMPTVHSEEIPYLFATGKTELYGLWNIVLDGHGLYPTNLNLDKPLPKIIQTFDIGYAYITGLKILQFKELIQFFIKKINVNFLYYLTCYGTGLNMVLPYISTLINQKGNIISDEKPNFTIATGGLLENTVGVYVTQALDECMKQKNKIELAEGSFNYGMLFSALHKYTKKDSFQATKFTTQELTEILKPVTLINQRGNDKIFSLPSVMLPGTDKFIVIPTDKTVEIITNVLVQTYQKERKKLIIDEKNAILIYPENITIDIDINPGKLDQYPYIVSMIPGLALHKFEKLKYSGIYTFYKFLISIELLNQVSPKFFYIKNLIIKNDEFLKLPDTPKRTEISLENVFIYSSKNNTIILFMYKNNIYYRSYNTASNHIFTSYTFKRKKRDLIIDNEFLNAIYNYFYDENELKSLKDEFNFAGLMELLSKEDITTLQNYEKRQKSRFSKKINFPIQNLLKDPDMLFEGQTFLSYAAQEDDLDAVEFILWLGANVDKVDTKGKTALYYAVINGYPEIVATLLRKGADSTKLFDNENLKDIAFKKMAQTSDPAHKNPEKYIEYKNIRDQLETLQKHPIVETYFKKPPTPTEKEALEEYVMV